jgi:uncharacterized RDD family membrane protein YckC
MTEPVPDDTPSPPAGRQPYQRKRPPEWHGLALGLLGALIAGIVFVVLWDAVDTAIKESARPADPFAPPEEKKTNVWLIVTFAIAALAFVLIMRMRAQRGSGRWVAPPPPRRRDPS